MLWLLATLHAETPREEEVYRRLSLREGFSCDTLGTVDRELRDILLGNSAPTLMPPAVPVRATECLVRQYGEDPEVLAQMQSWIADPSRAGDAMVVLESIDLLPENWRSSMILAALSHPDPKWRARFQVRLLESKTPAVVELVKWATAP